MCNTNYIFEMHELNKTLIRRCFNFLPGWASIRFPVGSFGKLDVYKSV